MRSSKHARKKRLLASQGRKENRKSYVKSKRKLRKSGLLKSVRLFELLSARKEQLRRNGTALKKEAKKTHEANKQV